MAAKKNDRRCICRYEHHYFEGWLVRVKRAGKAWSRYFSDGEGGREAAESRARAWRDSVVARVGVATKLKRHYSRSTTGIIGVSRETDRKKDGRIVERYRAGWPALEAGRLRWRSVSFSVAKWGKQGAIDGARAARAAGVARYIAAGGPEAATVPRRTTRKGPSAPGRRQPPAGRQRSSTAAGPRGGSSRLS